MTTTTDWRIGRACFIIAILLTLTLIIVSFASRASVAAPAASKTTATTKVDGVITQLTDKRITIRSGKVAKPPTDLAKTLFVEDFGQLFEVITFKRLNGMAKAVGEYPNGYQLDWEAKLQPKGSNILVKERYDRYALTMFSVRDIYKAPGLLVAHSGNDVMRTSGGNRPFARQQQWTVHTPECRLTVRASTDFVLTEDGWKGVKGRIAHE